MDTKTLRQKILDLAIRGKLVPQDPADEPATVLLERIRAEKRQMVKDGKLKPKDIKNDTVIFVGEDNLHYEQFPDGSIKCIEDEIPFDLPDGWAWTRLGNIFNHNTGKALNKTNKEGLLLPYITTSNLYWNRFELDNLKSMYFTDADIEKCTITKGDLLICEGGDIGRAAIWCYDYEMRIQNHIHRLRPYVDVNIELYYHIFYYYKLIGMINGKGIGIQGLSSNQLHSILFPFPPLSEQHRIVAKLNEFISFVDTIESDKANLQATIQLAKAKILDLAIRGKLVPQDPNDEPASVLLERIRSEKEELIKHGKIKRNKRESVIFRGEDNSYYEKIGENVVCIDEEIPFEIPKGWIWCRLYNATNIIMGSSPSGENLCNDSSYTEFHQGKIYFSKQIVSNSYQYTKEVTKIAAAGSILLCVRAPVGEVNLTDRPLCIGRGLAAIEPLDTISEKFLFHWLQAFKANLVSKATGTTFTAVTSDVVKKLLIPLPPLKEQTEILSQINTVFCKLNIIEKSLS